MSNQREILFRAKSILDKEWIWGHFYESRYEAWILNRDKISIKIQRETIGQYTGLKDRNGVKIFEGDVCKVIRHDGKCLETDSVYFHDGSFRVGHSYFDRLVYHDIDTEIIGNIHDNPELLTQKS